MRLEIETHLTKVHTLHSLTTQRWTDGRRWTRLPRAHDQFDNLVSCYCFLGHVVVMSETNAVAPEHFCEVGSADAEER
jgi:hypothetical protein